MCDICNKIKNSVAYKTVIDKMHVEDLERLANSKEIAKELKSITNMCYSSIKWPIKLVYPMFEARTAYSVPHNYFQGILIDDQKPSAFFAHGSMRSIFFVDKRLFLFSKNVAHDQTLDFFSSFLLVHFEKGEYKIEREGERINISVDLEKPLRNMITGELEKKRLNFNFVNESVKNRIVSKEQIAYSAHLKEVYSKYGGLASKIASIDLEGYAITVPHFSPHPYLLHVGQELGFQENRDFQENGVLEYFNAHL